MSEWNNSKLKDVCEITSSKRIFAHEYCKNGIPFFRSKEIIELSNNSDISVEIYIDREKYREIKEKFGVPQKNDILLTSVGTLGVVYLVKEENFYFKDGNLTWFKNYKDIHYKFLYYWLKSDYAINQMLQKAIGSSQKALTIEILKNIDISYPNLIIQNSIAQILSSFDDKIENCNKMIANLNAQIETLFKNWFIDYAPFADNLSEEGIPISWRRYKFSDFITLKNEKSSDSDIPEFSVTNTGIFPRNTRFNKLLSTNRSNKVIKRNDLVFGMSREILNWGVMEEEIGGVSSAYTVFEVDQTKVNSNYLSRYMSSNILYFMDVIKPAAREGQGIEKKVLYNKDIVVPDDISWERFLDIYQPMNNEIANQKKQIEKLANTRDTLLPKLMSGEIEVPVEE